MQRNLGVSIWDKSKFFQKYKKILNNNIYKIQINQGFTTSYVELIEPTISTEETYYLWK